MKKTSIFTYDILGISSATLCLIHCLALPLLTIIPLGISHNPWIDLFFCGVGLFAVVKILKSSAAATVKIILTISMGLILFSILGDLLWHYHSNLLYFGGFGMILGHLINFKTHRHAK